MSLLSCFAVLFPPPQYDENGKMIDDRNTEAGAKLNYKGIVRENAKFDKYYRCKLHT